MRNLIKHSGPVFSFKVKNCRFYSKKNLNSLIEGIRRFSWEPEEFLVILFYFNVFFHIFESFVRLIAIEMKDIVKSTKR